MMSLEMGPPVVASAAVSDFVLSDLALSALAPVAFFVESLPVVRSPLSPVLALGALGDADTIVAPPNPFYFASPSSRGRAFSKPLVLSVIWNSRKA